MIALWGEGLLVQMICNKKGYRLPLFLQFHPLFFRS